MAKKVTYNTHTKEELNRVVADTREELRNLRFSASGGKNRNVKLTGVLRKRIARVLTALSAQQTK
jgi:ribosomal protein L29